MSEIERNKNEREVTNTITDRKLFMLEYGRSKLSLYLNR